MKFGDKIRLLREAKGLSQAELAQVAGLYQSYVSRIEAGKQDNPTIDVASRFAKALGVSLNDLVGGGGETGEGQGAQKAGEQGHG